jgi:acyl transferase domain-containing protein
VASPGPYLFPLSGRTREALAARTADLARWMEHEGQKQALADIAYSLGAGRRHWPIRHMIVASTHAELLAGLHSLLSDGRQPVITAPAIAAAYMTGEDVNWLEHYRGAGLRRVPLPTYPFTGERHWVKTPTVAPKPIAVLNHETPQERLYAPHWRAEPLPAADGMPPAIALIEDGMEPIDAVDFIRKQRRGAINAKQLEYLQNVYTRQKKGACVVA